MTTEKYNRAREIKSIQSYLDKLYSAIYNAINRSHPQMLTNDNDTISFIGLGEKYEKELKDLITNFIEEKAKELDREFEEL